MEKTVVEFTLPFAAIDEGKCYVKLDKNCSYNGCFRAGLLFSSPNNSFVLDFMLFYYDNRTVRICYHF